MNVVPKGAPASTPANPADSARAKAIAAFNAQPVPNATQISPEEMSAVTSQVGHSDKEETPIAEGEVNAEPQKAKEDPLSSQYATLARKEKALRAQIQQFKAEQEKFKAERDSVKAPEIDYSRYIERDRLKADPLSAFEEAGLSYDELTEQVLARSQIQTDPRLTRQMAEMQAEIKAAREEAKALRDAQEGSQKQAYNQAVANIRAEAGKLVFTDPNFEMVKATNSVSDVVELIESTFKADGVLLSVEEACQAVEDHLLEEAMKLTKVKKLQQKLGQSTANPPVTNNKQPQTTSNSPKTLTNGMSGQKPMSARERALAAFEGKLKG